MFFFKLYWCLRLWIFINDEDDCDMWFDFLFFFSHFSLFSVSTNSDTSSISFLILFAGTVTGSSILSTCILFFFQQLAMTLWPKIHVVLPTPSVMQLQWVLFHQGPYLIKLYRLLFCTECISLYLSLMSHTLMPLDHPWEAAIETTRSPHNQAQIVLVF